MNTELRDELLLCRGGHGPPLDRTVFLFFPSKRTAACFATGRRARVYSLKFGVWDLGFWRFLLGLQLEVISAISRHGLRV
jgi:hypothetical protein